MGNRIWDDPPRDGVHSRPGLKTTGDYSGLHRSGQPFSPSRQAHGDEAQEQVNEAERRTLNVGEDFEGHLEEWKVGGFKFWVGTHQDYGPVVYPQIRAFYPENRIKVYCGDDGRELLLLRPEFFGGLLRVDPTWEAFEPLFEALRRPLVVLRFNGYDLLRNISKPKPPTVSK